MYPSPITNFRALLGIGSTSDDDDPFDGFMAGKFKGTDISVHRETVRPATQATKALMAMFPHLNTEAKRATVALPEYVNWADIATSDPTMRQELPSWIGVKQLHGLVMKPLHQYHCDFCFVFSTATVLSDRWAIKLFADNPGTMAYNPNLSPSSILSCMNCHTSTGKSESCSDCTGKNGEWGKNGRCRGGSPTCAAQFLETQGIEPLQCRDFTWCEHNLACHFKGHDEADKVDAVIPKCVLGSCWRQCNKAEQCLDTIPMKLAEVKRFSALKGSTESVGEGDQKTRRRAIASELFMHGPVIGNFRVMGDAIGALDAVDWDATQNVYCRYTPDLKDVDKLGVPKAIDLYTGTRAGTNDFAGNHSVAIVGWGKQDVTFPNNPKLPDELRGKTVSLGYWIVRNSWGPRWNSTGYWKQAMSDEKYKLNIGLGLDHFTTDEKGKQFGGALVFLPGEAVLESDKNHELPAPTPQQMIVRCTNDDPRTRQCMTHGNATYTLPGEHNLLYTEGFCSSSGDDGCTWIGTFPFCAASETDCENAGREFLGYSDSGDGRTCWTGQKVLCGPKQALRR